MSKEHYKKAIFNSGIIPVLLSLSHFERIEDYEECAKIYSITDFWIRMATRSFEMTFQPLKHIP